MSDKTNLVYHMWIPCRFEDFSDTQKEIFNIHIKCLKRYSNIFDEAIFVLAIDDTNDLNTLKKIQTIIIDCGFKNIKFKTVKNDKYVFEGDTYCDELLKKLDRYDGITFFAHSKGMSNNKNVDIDKLKIWICGMYYWNLNFIEEVKNSLLRNTCITFGAYLNNLDDWHQKLYNCKWIYSGSFQWINTKKLKNFLDTRNISYIYKDRIIAENFLGRVLPFEFSLISSHGEGWLKSVLDLYYNDVTDLYLYPDSEKNDFREFVKDIV